MSYITMRDLSVGADLGAQMMALAGLYSITKISSHTPTIINERFGEGYGIRIKPEIFPNFYNTFKLVNFLEHQWEWKQFNNVLCDKEIYNGLDPNINYNFPVRFSTYHYWIGLENEIKKLFEFAPSIKKTSQDLITGVKAWSNNKEIVAIHFRRGDYLALSSVKLSLDYYYEALKNYDKSKCCILLFSNSNNDIEWINQNFKPEGWEVYNTDHNYKERMDMYMMSLCDHNIIANSTYSWWGAFLNENPSKKVICPYYYLDVPHLNYINGNYYPKEWKAMETI